MKTYTYDETLALLNSAMESEGKGEEFVYNHYGRPERNGPVCHYAWEGQPDCIVGHVFAAVGVPIEEMEYGDGGEFDNRGRYSENRAGRVAVLLEEDGVVAFTPKARRLLNVAQSEQDNGAAWGASIKRGAFMAGELNEDEYTEY